MLSRAIIIDTKNLKPSAGKATPADHEALRLLVDHLTRLDPTIQLNLASVYQELKLRKFDVSRLSSHDLLIRDFKRYAINGHELSLSSVPLSLEEWSRKMGWDQIAAAIRQVMDERQLDICSILTSFVVGKEDRRQILVAYTQEEWSALKPALEREGKEQLALEPWSDEDIPSLDGFKIFVWNQINTVSRKQIAPAFQRALSSLGNAQ